MKNKLSRFAVPYVVWMAIFVVAPILIMVVYAFSNADGGATLDNFVQMGGYAAVFGRSFKLAIIATAICLLIGYPAAYFLSSRDFSRGRAILVLILLPMWMNFLLRTYAMMTLLERNGVINTVLEALGLPHQNLIGTEAAVLLGMVYNFLPFMILPIYTVMKKMDRRVIEAAEDLGAPPRTVFARVVIPLSLHRESVVRSRVSISFSQVRRTASSQVRISSRVSALAADTSASSWISACLAHTSSTAGWAASTVCTALTSL